MASETDICILALRRLGQEANLNSLEDNSAYVETAKASLPIVKDALLERHAWNFATTKVRPAKLDEKPIGWDAMYAIPSDCLRVLSVFSEKALDELTSLSKAMQEVGYSDSSVMSAWHSEDQWVVEMWGPHRVLETNIEQPVLKYVRSVKETGLFSPTFTDALVWHLSASLAGPIVKGETGLTVSNKLLEVARYYEGVAIMSDVNQRHTHAYKPEAPWVGV